MDALINALEKTCKTLGIAFGWLIVPLIFALCYEVAARHLFSAPTIWAFEVGYMFMAAIFLMGGAYALLDNRHIRIDFLSSRFSPRAQAIADLIGFIVLLMPVMLVLAWFGMEKAFEAIKYKEVSDLTPWRPVMWPFRMATGLGFVLLCLQGIAEILRRLNFIVSAHNELKRGQQNG